MKPPATAPAAVAAFLPLPPPTWLPSRPPTTAPPTVPPTLPARSGRRSCTVTSWQTSCGVWVVEVSRTGSVPITVA
ncbi:hypothetical protein G6F59_015833 [Rhizopus arrhizus]|nr:hypothetical protein G6F59_015833 [Rhizopus arrhizus]